MTSAVFDYKIADLSLADFGRAEMTLAEHEMPGLMAMRAEFANTKPLKGSRIAGSLHMTIQTAVLIESLTALGASVRWPGHPGPTMILDDGGDATLFVHKGLEFERAGFVPAPESADSEEYRVILGLLDRIVSSGEKVFGPLSTSIIGVSEETTTGVHRLYEMQRDGTLLFPAINVNDAVTKSKFDNKYGCRHSLIDGINRATDTLIGGKVAVICGYGDVGKGCAESLKGQGGRVIITEIDPICALQAAMDGFQVTTLEEALPFADIIITATGNRDIVSVENILMMKHQAILGNIGHFDNEIDIAGLANLAGVKRENIKPQVDKWILPNGRAIVLLSEGRLLNLGNATGHPSFVMSNSFTNQVMAQIELFVNNANYEKKVYVLPKHLDEKVARLHLDALGVKLTTLTKRQADYIGVAVEGPYKPDTYRY